MQEMTIKNMKDDENYLKSFNSVDDAKQWVINHLDLSKKWDIKTYFDCLSCGHEKNLEPNMDCKDCSYSAKKFKVYSKLGLEDRLY
jgi:hypothetical protein